MGYIENKWDKEIGVVKLDELFTNNKLSKGINSNLLFDTYLDYFPYFPYLPISHTPLISLITLITLNTSLY